MDYWQGHERADDAWPGVQDPDVRLLLANCDCQWIYFMRRRLHAQTPLIVRFEEWAWRAVIRPFLWKLRDPETAHLLGLHFLWAYLRFFGYRRQR